ncbi:MAG: TetR/AcrR family transcriptional regulator, partial [Muribaculaceae bacterium]|nr:TetR/AcrR family transcriptional regulator [Muribaculaceae bacterium]
MDTKESLIIKEAGKLLAKVGPLAMTMDAVAHNCGISKRTLYEVFPDKKSLIRQCLDLEHAKHDKELKEIFESSANCFEALFRTYKQIRLYLQGGAYKVGEEVARIYPDIFEDHAEKEKRIVRQLSGLLAKAQTEGHVVQAIDTDIA